MLTDDLTEREHVYGEEDGTEYRALWHSMDYWGMVGAGTIDGDKLLPVRQIRVEPGENGSGESKVGGEAVEKYGMGDSVEGC